MIRHRTDSFQTRKGGKIKQTHTTDQRRNTCIEKFEQIEAKHKIVEINPNIFTMTRNIIN